MHNKKLQLEIKFLIPAKNYNFDHFYKAVFDETFTNLSDQNK